MSTAYVPYVVDDGQQGLQISTSGLFGYWRHSAWCSAGQWAVSIYPEGDLAEFLGDHPIDRAAVVDDFGSLVMVGAMQ